MSVSDTDIAHFLHITCKRYRKELRRLEKLYQENSFLVKPNETVQNRQLLKYWRRRYSLFSKFDKEPIYLTQELWYSVCPESIAKFIAKFAKASLPNATKALDVCCGGGGNTIQLAFEFEKVYGVDLSIDHLYCSYRNAVSYGVNDRMWLKYGSWEDIAERGRFTKLGIDFIFSSPPWGGPQYLKQKVYDLETLGPKGLTWFLHTLVPITPNIILFLPRNSDLKQVSEVTREVFGPQGRCRVVYIKDNGFTKGILCIWGTPLVNAGQEDERTSESTGTHASLPSNKTVH